MGKMWVESQNDDLPKREGRTESGSRLARIIISISMVQHSLIEAGRGGNEHGLVFEFLRVSLELSDARELLVRELGLLLAGRVGGVGHGEGKGKGGVGEEETNSFSPDLCEDRRESGIP